MKRLYFLIPIFLAVILTSGCVLTLSQPKAVDPDVTGGIFKTIDQGVSWQQLGLIPTISDKKINLFSLDTSALVADPTDNKTFYLGTFADGLMYTYDSGGSWQIMRSLGQKAIIDIAVDPKDKCNIYVATVGRIFKTIDCGRSWQEVYSDNDKRLIIYSVVVDHFNSQNIYIATARGDVIKSRDGGQSWHTLNNFGAGVRKLIMDPKDSRLLIAAVNSKGLFKTTNSGISWQDLAPRLKIAKANKGFRDLVAAPSTNGFYLLAVDDGLFKTANYGEDWTEINLIPPENRSKINALAIDPFDNKVIYYDTNTTFYSTVDGGQNWSSRKLPTSRQGSKILVSPAKNGAVYLGVKTQ